MADWRYRVLSAPLAALDAYSRGDLTLEDVQGSLDTAARVLESPDQELAEAMQSAEGKIEIIRATVSEGEQRVAATHVIESIRSRIAAAIAE